MPSPLPVISADYRVRRFTYLTGVDVIQILGANPSRYAFALTSMPRTQCVIGTTSDVNVAGGLQLEFLTDIILITARDYPGLVGQEWYLYPTVATISISGYEIIHEPNPIAQPIRG